MSETMDVEIICKCGTKIQFSEKELNVGPNGLTSGYVKNCPVCKILYGARIVVRKCIEIDVDLNP